MSGFVYFMTNVLPPLPLDVGGERCAFRALVAAAHGHPLMVKIGFTSRHPLKRLADLRGMSAGETDLAGFVEGDMGLEAQFHQTFMPLRDHNEWFRAPRDSKLWDLVFYLNRYGGAARPTSDDELDAALEDSIWQGLPPHPSVDPGRYLGSVDLTCWGNESELCLEPMRCDWDTTWLAFLCREGPFALESARPASGQ